MSNTFLPFNFAPKAHEVLDTSGLTTYTIPANEFAMALVNFTETSSQGVVELNSEAILRSSYYTLGSTDFGAAINAYLTVPAQGITYWSLFDTVTGAALGDGVTVNGGVAGGVGGTTNIRRLKTHTRYEASGNSHSPIWLKAGDTIAISGGSVRVTIHRYDLPS
jgi:hypothetical protein